MDRLSVAERSVGPLDRTQWRIGRAYPGVWAVGFAALVLLLGGASKYNPLQMLAIELASLPVLGFALAALKGVDVRAVAVPLPLLVAIVALPLLQLIPL